VIDFVEADTAWPTTYILMPRLTRALAWWIDPPPARP
jgi:hypothetical protein